MWISIILRSGKTKLPVCGANVYREEWAAFSPARRGKSGCLRRRKTSVIFGTHKRSLRQPENCRRLSASYSQNKCVWPFPPFFLRLKIPTFFSFVLHFLLDSSGRQCYNNRGRFVKKITMISFRMFLFRRAYIAGERAPASGKAGEKSMRFFCFFAGARIDESPSLLLQFVYQIRGMRAAPEVWRRTYRFIKKEQEAWK